jgi:hypothetical protein
LKGSLVLVFIIAFVKIFYMGKIFFLGIVLGGIFILLGKDSSQEDKRLAERIKKLIDELDDDSWEVRERATEELLKIGRATIPFLERAKDDRDVEKAWRIQYLLEEFDRPGFIGIRISELTPQMREELGYKGEGGVLIVELLEGDFPARKIGLEPDDVIFELDGKKVKSVQELVDMVSSKKMGNFVRIKLWRKGRQIEFKKVRLAGRPEEW